MSATLPAKARARSPSVPPKATPTVTLHDRLLVVRFDGAVRAASWAIVNGGLVTTTDVVWVEVRDDELRPPVDARAYLRRRLLGHAGSRAVGLLTSRCIATYSDVTADSASVTARAVVTVGLGNALAAGDPAGPAARIGTINLLVHVDVALTDEALLESVAIATEAKSAAIVAAGIPSRLSGRPATGTGTDCTVVTSDTGAANGRFERYAGKHTHVGAAVGQAAGRAVAEGAARWLREVSR